MTKTYKFRGFDNPRPVTGNAVFGLGYYKGGALTVGKEYVAVVVDMYGAPDECTAGAGSALPDAKFFDDVGHPVWECLAYFDEVANV